MTVKRLSGMSFDLSQNFHLPQAERKIRERVGSNLRAAVRAQCCPSRAVSAVVSQRVDGRVFSDRLAKFASISANCR
jgi:hypothetical protein